MSHSNMALPQRVIEQLGREPVRTPGWSGTLLMLTGTLFFISILIAGGLTYGYQPYLNAQVKALDAKIKKFSEDVPVEDQQKILVFSSQLINLKKLLKQHIFISPVLEWLQKNTSPNVYYSKMVLDVAKKSISLSGSAKTVNDFAEQVQVFSVQPEIVSATFTNLGLGKDNLWTFDIGLTAQADLFSGLARTTVPSGGEEGASAIPGANQP